jgi:membrane-bound acyltransferase YfiQ involved in biofilm formation
MSPSVAPFLAGLITMCFVGIGLCFARFWSLNRDPLFIAFAFAFWLLAANQAFVGLSIVPREEQSWVYLLRIAAFVVIAIAIAQKNFSRENSGKDTRRRREDLAKRQPLNPEE